MVKRVFTFYPNLWLAAFRILIYGSAEFGGGLQPGQMAVLFAFVESVTAIIAQSWVTSNAKLDPETVAAARAGSPAPGMPPYSAQSLLDQSSAHYQTPTRVDPLMGAAGSSSQGVALPSSGYLSIAASRELDRMMGELIPPGRKGAAVTIVDLNGARLGVAVKHGDAFSASLELSQPWEDVKPSIRLQIRATW